VERTCCAWAQWDVGRADGELVLEVHASLEGAAVLQSMFSGREAEPE
jgi:hypothetical protein